MENPNGAVPGNSQNTPTANVPRTFSTFPLKYHMFDTHRFGEYHPHYVEEGVKEDILPIRSSHNVMSYTLKSPLLQSITMKKDYFSVPMEAILPFNWEKFFDNPVRGDDVSDNVGCTVENFWNKIDACFRALNTQLDTTLAASATTDAQAMIATLRFLVFAEYFYSNGNLMASLGCHGSPYITYYKSNKVYSFDAFFDSMLSAVDSALSGTYAVCTVDNYTYNVVSEGELDNSYNCISLRHFLSLIRDNPLFVVSSFGNTVQMKTTLKNEKSTWTFSSIAGNVPHNLAREFAYQIVCSHYYSNDHIDYIYSAELYRQLLGAYLIRCTQSDQETTNTFVRNGFRYRYDWCSAYYFDIAISKIQSTPAVLTNTALTGAAIAGLAYLSAVFAYRRSLRYLDYFTGSRAQPLAVGSTGVTVSGGSVDVVDITRNIQRQRFLNAVNRVRHNFEGYLQGIFGGDVPAPDYHNPFFLASTEDTIYGQETENTGYNQMTDQIAITSNLRSNGSRYMLEIRCDRPCVIIGITHYDLARVYSKSTERMFLHKDRFDMFNPFMQFIGDQPVYLQELGVNPSGTQLSTMSNWSYSLRHMEYKQRFSQAAGGFVENLPGWCFLADDLRGDQNSINPDWIRSVPSEIDNFYVSLTGWSLGSYFHFIVDNYNDCSGKRPMAYAPSIL